MRCAIRRTVAVVMSVLHSGGVCIARADYSSAMCRFGRWSGDVVVLGQTRPAFEISVLYSFNISERLLDMRTYGRSFA